MITGTQGIQGPRSLEPKLPTLTISTGGTPITSKDTYISGTYTLKAPGITALTGSLQIRGRGNTTWELWHADYPNYPPKKPYRLNFATAIAPLGMTAQQRNWGLLAEFFDTSKVKNAFAFTLAQRMSGLEWAAEYRHVEVVLNGVYIGVYLLCDLARIETGRIAPPKASGSSGINMTGTYLFELDTYWDWDNEPGFYTSRGLAVAFDDPDGSNSSQAAYLESYLNEFETRLYGSSWLDAEEGYATMIDSTSFADWYWVNELIMQLEVSHPKSVKMYKKRDSSTERGKLGFSTPWDHDLTLGADWPDEYPVERNLGPEGWYVRTQGWWFIRLVQDPAFVSLLNERWAALMLVIEDMGGIDQWFDNFFGGDIAQALIRDREYWSTIPGGLQTPGAFSPNEESEYVKQWVKDRITWIDSQI